MSKQPILTPFLDDIDVILYAGDCIEVMRQMPEASVDAIVTDPPYGLEFMGKDWDAPWKNDGDVLDDPASVGGFQDGAGGNPYSRSRIRYGRSSGFQTWTESWAREAFRILKPGGHLLAFAGTRTYHRMASGVEDAGFEIRDCIAWMYGSGFPKSLDVSKAIDKAHPRIGLFDAFAKHLKESRIAAGLSQKDIASHFPSRTGGITGCVWNWENAMNVPTREQWSVLQSLLDLTDEWTSLIDRVEAEREVVGKHSGDMGGLGGERLGAGAGDITAPATPEAGKWNGWGTALKPAFEPIVVARKPLIGTVAANVLEHGTGALNIDACRIEGDMSGGNWGGKQGTSIGYGGNTEGSGYQTIQNNAGRWPANIALDATAANILDQQSGHQKDGTATRRNLPDSGAKQKIDLKAPAKRGHDVTFGGEGGASRFFYTAKASRHDRNQGALAENTHPTVKPTELMRWLIRLVTPPGGIILDPFGGSGSTGLAARAENTRCILIEREPEYLQIIRDRLSQLNLFTENNQ
jgi:DNA modification methylase